MKNLLILAALALGACDHEPEGPSTCVDWLRCYDSCQWNAFENRSSDLILHCEKTCRVELDYHADDPPPEVRANGTLVNDLVVADLRVIDAIDVAEMADDIGEAAFHWEDATWDLEESRDQRVFCLNEDR